MSHGTAAPGIELLLLIQIHPIMATVPKEETSTADDDDGGGGDDNNQLLWYFAIGSMMHPKSCEGRDFVPIRSRPAKLIGFKLGFFTKMGMAEAIPSSPDSYMHGVLHQVTPQQMLQLDQIEMGYLRQTGTAIPYGCEKEEEYVTATVYCRDEEKIKQLKSRFSKNRKSGAEGKEEEEEEAEAIPTQRYIDLLAEGASHWGVDQEYIDMIRNRKVRPRTDPADFRNIPPPTDSQNFDSIPEDTPDEIHFSLNGKIVCYTYPNDHMMYQMTRTTKSGRGPHIEMNTARIIYDPKYGLPSTLDEFTKEHSAYIEDLTWRWMTDFGSEEYLNVLGTYTPQTWIDG